MGKYDNRLSCKPCNQGSNASVATNPTQPTASTSNSVTELPKGSDALSTIECGKKILSITKIGEKVVVMYEDCSYTTAPLSVVAKETFNYEAINCLSKSVKAVALQFQEIKDRLTTLENKPDVDTIYNDAELRARIVALEGREDRDTVYDDTDVTKRLRALESKPESPTYDDTNLRTLLDNSSRELKTLIREMDNKFGKYVSKDELIIVENNSGSELFKAFPME